MPSYDPYGPPTDWEDEEEQSKEPKAPSAPVAPKAATHSDLDALIEAVSGQKAVRVVKTCEKCGSDQFRFFSPLEGGLRMRVCRKCKTEVPVASVATACPVPGMQVPVPGPYAGQPMPSMQMLRETRTFRLRTLMEDMANDVPTSENPFGRR